LERKTEGRRKEKNANDARKISVAHQKKPWSNQSGRKRPPTGNTEGAAGGVGTDKFPPSTGEGKKKNGDKVSGGRPVIQRIKPSLPGKREVTAKPVKHGSLRNVEKKEKARKEVSGVRPMSQEEEEREPRQILERDWGRGPGGV